MPANASVATARASTRCLADGVVNRWTCAVSRSGCMATSRPDRDHGELQGDVGQRQDDQRALTDVAGEAGDVDAAANAITAAATAISAQPCVKPPQIGLR